MKWKAVRIMTIISRQKLRKDKQIATRVLEDEYILIKRLACASGLTVSSYVREILLSVIMPDNTSEK